MLEPDKTFSLHDILLKGVSHMKSFAVVSGSLRHDKPTALADVYCDLLAGERDGMEGLRIG